MKILINKTSKDNRIAQLFAEPLKSISHIGYSTDNLDEKDLEEFCPDMIIHDSPSRFKFHDKYKDRALIVSLNSIVAPFCYSFDSDIDPFAVEKKFTAQKNLQCDFSFIGDLSEELEVADVLSQLSKKYRVKSFGKPDFTSSFYCGFTNDDYSVYASARYTIMPNRIMPLDLKYRQVECLYADGIPISTNEARSLFLKSFVSDVAIQQLEDSAAEKRIRVNTNYSECRTLLGAILKEATNESLPEHLIIKISELYGKCKQS
jgi:hypothetical protein